MAIDLRADETGIKVLAYTLEKHLPNVGHSKMLEAISKTLGYKDWNSLAAELKKKGVIAQSTNNDAELLKHKEPRGAEPTAADDEHQYVLVGLYYGYASTTFVKGEALAIRAFIQEANLLSDLFPDEELRVHGQDIDAGLPGLVLTVAARPFLLLQTPSMVDGSTMSGNRKTEAPKVALPGIDDENTFTGVARWLDWAYADKEYGDPVRRREAAMNSWPALHITREYGELYQEVERESAEELGISLPHGDRRALRDAFERIRLLYSAFASVRR